MIRRVAVTLLAGALLAAGYPEAAGAPSLVAIPAFGGGTPPTLSRVFSGSATGTPATLAVRDAFGTASLSAGYLRLDPEGGRFVGVFVFHPPPGPLDLRVVLRTVAPRKWRLEAWNAATGSWDTLWAGGGAPAGRWTVRLLPTAAAHRDAGKVRLRLVGQGSRLHLDQLTLHSRPGVWRPPPGTTWQWQLAGAVDPSFDVAMYDIDLFDAPQAIINRLHADGRAVVCYFSAGSWENWRPDAASFPNIVKGKPLEGWPGERWLDIRRLDLLGPVMKARLDLAAEKGCDGVEPDNVDAYANPSGFALTGADQAAYNRWLAAQARRRGLSVGLKNDLGQVPALVAHFDWALNEQCFEYDECAALLPFVAAGRAVFGVEYSGRPAGFCSEARALGFSWLKKRPALGAWAVFC